MLTQYIQVNFTFANCHKTSKFAKDFSLESFLLYGMYLLSSLNFFLNWIKNFLRVCGSLMKRGTKSVYVSRQAKNKQTVTKVMVTKVIVTKVMVTKVIVTKVMVTKVMVTSTQCSTIDNTHNNYILPCVLLEAIYGTHRGHMYITFEPYPWSHLQPLCYITLVTLCHWFEVSPKPWPFSLNKFHLW